MTAKILSVGTAVPTNVLHQSTIRDLFAAQPNLGRLAQRLVRSAFDASAIERRHTAIPDLANTADRNENATFVTGPDFVLQHPTTKQRNDVYIAEAPPLFAAAARNALEESGVRADEITHVVTASCTGFYAPGPDYRLVRDLGLSTRVERYHIGFLGCAAAFPALRAAERIVAAQPGSHVLVVCGELCSLHVRSSEDPEQIVAAAVFADGASAAVVSDSAPRGGRPALELNAFATAITEQGEHDMRWIIGDEGFEMTLTAEVPRIIGREIIGAIEGFLDPANIDAWAVHPGGKSILDRVEAGLDLDESALDDSRAVLRDYGNMSSATIMFILRRLLVDESLVDGSRIAGLAFGPGLTVEQARFTKVGAVAISDLVVPIEEGMHDSAEHGASANSDAATVSAA
ncbi:type III polyketide synthase [Humidisolicoccus flavus]|uniref:type III polyketide synthase n=1 Tax=Humidisolicoccus flavus TaxID=3111414 RepID=UPI00325679B6